MEFILLIGLGSPMDTDANDLDAPTVAFLALPANFLALKGMTYWIFVAELRQGHSACCPPAHEVFSNEQEGKGKATEDEIEETLQGTKKLSVQAQKDDGSSIRENRLKMPILN
jgi:hypothetical protein